MDIPGKGSNSHKCLVARNQKIFLVSFIHVSKILFKALSALLLDENFASLLRKNDNFLLKEVTKVILVYILIFYFFNEVKMLLESLITNASN